MRNRRYFIQTPAIACLSTVLLISGCLQAMATDTHLAWDPSGSPNIAGYNVNVGNAPRAFNPPITIGNQTTYTVTGLASGTYCFPVTAFDSSGNESDYSNEIWTKIGAPPHTRDINGKSFTAAPALISRLQNSVLYIHVVSNDLYFTGIAILNPSASSVISNWNCMRKTAPFERPNTNLMAAGSENRACYRSIHRRRGSTRLPAYVKVIFTATRLHRSQGSARTICP